MRRRLRRSAALLLAGAALFALPARPAAHEIPPNVTVLAFVRPEGDVLRLLVRVPLESLRDVEFPLRGPGYLVLDGIEPLLTDAVRLWIADYIELHEEGVTLGEPRIADLRVSLPSDLSFTRWETALAHVRGPRIHPDTDLPWQQALVDVLFEFPIASDVARFSVRPGLAHLGIRTVTVLRYLPVDGPERVLRYEGDPGLVRLDPRWTQAFVNFAGLGFRHILGGLDHLLFLLCLVIPVRRVRPLIAIVTAFTVAHSITLVASALGLAPDGLWFPPLIETLIALSIVWMAFENIVWAADRRTGDAAADRRGERRLERRWLVAFAFGLVHGFGFSFLLRESLQFAAGHLVAALLAFNVGVELGQIAVLLLTVPALALLFRRVVPERVGAILVSALVAHSAWHWMTARGGQLAQYELSRPVPDMALLAAVMRGLMLLLIAAGAAWLLSALFGRLAGTGTGRQRPARAPR